MRGLIYTEGDLLPILLRTGVTPNFKQKSFPFQEERFTLKADGRISFNYSGQASRP